MNIRNLFIASLAIAPLSAYGVDDLSYTYLEADFVNLDIDEVGDNDSLSDLDDGNGIAFRGSYGFDTSPFGFADSWFIFANYFEAESDVTFVDDLGVVRPADTDVIRVDLGAGVAVPFNDMSQLVFRLGYSDIDLDGFDFGASDTTSIGDLSDDSSDGFFLDGAWRGQVTPMMEISAGLRYTDIEETDNISFIGNALFEITPNWGVNLSADVGDELTLLGVGARFTF
ncbi:MAG: hypothetical protein WDZ30_04900 [Cellvibrionaceae bacterium]